ncbi:kinesin motor domain-containing protein [Mortierella sp. GBAus27b]|nr:kinesin motor domain-containing protein [Mortierella sp. GBAus27b]
MAKPGKQARTARLNRRKEQTPPPRTPTRAPTRTQGMPPRSPAQLDRRISITTTPSRPEILFRQTLQEHTNLARRRSFLPPSKSHAFLRSPAKSKVQRIGLGLPSFTIAQSPTKQRTPSKKSEHSSRLSLSDLALPSWSAMSEASFDSSLASDTQGNNATTGESNLPETPEMEPIKTFLRLRPSSESTASDSNNHGYVRILGDTDIVMTPPANARAKASTRHKFSKVFSQSATQTEVFEQTCLPLLRSVLKRDSQNALLFAYGVSNSGKTHSILGSSEPGDAGILPRALAVIFRSIETHAQDTGEASQSSQYRPIGFQDVEEIFPSGARTGEDDDIYDLEAIKSLDSEIANFADKLNIPLDNVGVRNLVGEENSEVENHVIELLDGMDYAVWISCAEIYNEKIFDLLAEPSQSSLPALGNLDPKRPSLQLKTDQSTGQKYVHGQKEVCVMNLEEALLVLRAGLRQRQVFSTLLNETSSRSHCIFTIKVIKSPQPGNSAEETFSRGKTTVSRLSIVDLAGSERVRNTNSTGQRRREAGNINNSLMVLGHCMEIIRLNQMPGTKAQQMVPYNRSKLTQLFQSALDGQSKSSVVGLIINVNPFQNEFDETIQTLRFSAVTMDVLTVSRPNDESAIASKPNSPTATRSSFQRVNPSHTKPLPDTVDDTLAANLLLSSLRNQIDDLYERLEAAEERCRSMEAQQQTTFMDELTTKIATAYAVKETQSRSTSPPVYEEVNMGSGEADQQDRECSFTTPSPTQTPPPRHNLREMDENDLRSILKDVDMESSHDIVTKSNNARELELKLALDQANRTIAAWQSWFKNAPISAESRSLQRIGSLSTSGEIAVLSQTSVAVAVSVTKPEPVSGMGDRVAIVQKETRTIGVNTKAAEEKKTRSVGVNTATAEQKRTRSVGVNTAPVEQKKTRTIGVNTAAAEQKTSRAIGINTVEKKSRTVGVNTDFEKDLIVAPPQAPKAPTRDLGKIQGEQAVKQVAQDKALLEIVSQDNSLAHQLFPDEEFETVKEEDPDNQSVQYDDLTEAVQDETSPDLFIYGDFPGEQSTKAEKSGDQHKSVKVLVEAPSRDRTPVRRLQQGKASRENSPQTKTSRQSTPHLRSSRILESMGRDTLDGSDNDSQASVVILEDVKQRPKTGSNTVAPRSSKRNKLSWAEYRRLLPGVVVEIPLKSRRSRRSTSVQDARSRSTESEESVQEQNEPATVNRADTMKTIKKSRLSASFIASLLSDASDDEYVENEQESARDTAKDEERYDHLDRASSTDMIPDTPMEERLVSPGYDTSADTHVTGTPAPADITPAPTGIASAPTAVASAPTGITPALAEITPGQLLNPVQLSTSSGFPSIETIPLDDISPFHSPSPLINSRSPSPPLHSKSPSPLGHSASPSPPLHSKSPSPRRHSTSPSPPPSSRSPSPRGRSRSPSLHLPSKSPSLLGHSRSPSVDVHPPPDSSIQATNDLVPQNLNVPFNPFLDDDGDEPSVSEILLKRVTMMEVSKSPGARTNDRQRDLDHEDGLFQTRGVEPGPGDGGVDPSTENVQPLAVDSGRGQETIEDETENGGITVDVQVVQEVLNTPVKKRKRKLRAKNAVFAEEMEETVGIPPPQPTRRKRGVGRRW